MSLLHTVRALLRERRTARAASRAAAQDQALALRTEQAADAADVTPRASPLVSIILPTRDRAALLPRALASIAAQTYAHWECLIVDDGSTDATRACLAPFLADPRFRCLAQPPAGAAAARNHGLREARGELVAYLDSDNRWFRTYLAWVVHTFETQPEAGCAYAAQLVHAGTRVTLRGEAFDAERLRRGNYIDISAFAHHRMLYDRLGGFDEALTSLMDWDLILRYTRAAGVARLPVTGGSYYYGAAGQISAPHLPHGYNWFRVREKHRPPRRGATRVLYALWHYPQASETYVRAEIRAALAAGFTLAAWSQEDVAVPYPSEVPVHRGPLAHAVAAFRPDVLHVHWLNIAEALLSDPARAALPLTARAHGFEFTPARAEAIAAHPDVAALFVFPHQRAALNGAGRKIHGMRACFNPEWFRPTAEKDRRLVVRTGTGLASKNYAAFLEAAAQCPGHRFVLVLCHAFRAESQTDAIVAQNARLGSPATVLVDLPNEEAAAWVSRAGLYLYTTELAGPRATPLGMPVSIAEALATGCVVLAPDCAALRDYIGDAGAFYDSAARAAELVRGTATWSEARWREAQAIAASHAYYHHASPEVLAPLFDAWESLSPCR